MSWTILSPITKSTAAARVTASIRELKSGRKLQVFISAMLHDELKQPDRCDVMAGSAEFAGQLRIEFKSDGAFALIKAMGGSRRLEAPPFSGLPGQGGASAACRIVAASPEALVIELPVEAWTAAQAARPKPAAPNAPAVRLQSGKLDLTVELQRWGFTAAKRPGDRWSINGETHSKSRALAKVNLARNRAGQPMLLEDEVE